MEFRSRVTFSLKMGYVGYLTLEKNKPQNMKRRADTPLDESTRVIQKKKREETKTQHYEVILNTTKEKYQQKIEQLPYVVFVKKSYYWTLEEGQTRYLVKLSKPVRSTHFKSIPYIHSISKCSKFNEPIDEDCSDEQEEDTFDSEETKYVKSTYKRPESEFGRDALYKSWKKNERLSDARLRRDLDHIRISKLLGISADIPDETKFMKPDKIYWRKEPKSYDNWFLAYPWERPVGHVLDVEKEFGIRVNNDFSVTVNKNLVED